MTDGETIACKDLAGEVEILTDRWGIPHIFAGSRPDAYLAQGFQAARDRLWQIDLWRKRGLGLLSADLGEDFVERDRAARLVLYRGDMAAEWAVYGPDAEATATAFVAGINAYVALTERSPDLLPVEFRALGTRPARWAPADPVRIRSHGRTSNLDREIVRNDLVAAFGLDAEAARRRPDPPWELRIPDGWVAEPIPPEVARTYRFATEPPPFDDVPVPGPLSSLSEGSNGWALSPHRTATGRPILASDPHRAMSLPSLRYISHLNAPGLDVIGASEPSMPGISTGHNEDVAFAFTIFPVDQADLYVYELSPDDPRLYRYGDGWERMRIVSESLSVRGGASRTVELAFTRHGPVLHADAERGRAYALRTVWTEPGAAPYLASLRYQTATCWEEFAEARSHWVAPPVNHVYADLSGRIAWTTSGALPIRPNWDGLMPVPGDGRYEWAGRMPDAAHPRLVDPPAGWVATANQMNLPAGFDVARYKPGFEWPDPARFHRIATVLGSRERHGLVEMQALQLDVCHGPAKRLQAVLRGLDLPDGAARRARDLICGWDGHLDAGSGPGALFEIWFLHHLMPAVSERIAPGAFPLFSPDETSNLDTAQLVDILERGDPRLGSDLAAARLAILPESLEAAFRDLSGRLGPDPAGWSWGALHTILFEHPLSRRLADPSLDVGPFPRGGSGLTIANGDYRFSDLRMVLGASWRMVVDVGDWDRSVCINTPGQSGDPASPHYADLAETWQRGGSVPLLFSRSAIEAATESRLRLVPERPEAPAEAPRSMRAEPADMRA